MNQEEDSADYQIYPASLPRQEKSDEFIDENTEEEDIQSLESLNTSYRDYRRQDEETVHPLLSELDEQLIGAKYFTEQDVCWGYDNEQNKDEDKWEMAKTNRILFEPMVIFSSSYYSPTTSQTNMDGIFLDQRNERRIDIDNDSETKEQNTEYTQSVPRRSRDNDLSTEPEGYTSWVTRTEYDGLPNPENQLQANPMKLYSIDKWPTPAMTTEVKSFLGFGNVDKGLIQDNWTLTEPLKELLETDETFRAKKNEQDDNDMTMLPEDSFPNSLNHRFDDERTFVIDDEQSDPIKSLSVHGLKTLCNHFSKVAAATSVNDVIAVNVMNMDLRKWITMARIVNDTINLLSGRRPNIRKDILEDWFIWILRLPNRDTALTNHSTLWYSKTIQELDGRQARRNPFLSKRLDQYSKENTDNQDRLLLPDGTLIKSVDKKLYRLIGEDDNVQNIFYAPMEGILLPWNPRTPQRRRNNLLFYTETFSFGIHPGHPSLDQLKSLGSRMVMENHRSTKGVNLRISEPYNDGTTEIPDKSISDRKPRFASHKFKRPFGFKSTTKTAHYPWKNRTTEWMNSETWKIFSPTLEHLSRIRTNTEARKTFQKVKETFYPQKSNKLTQKRERFSEESKKPSIFRNYHPELLNNWKSYPTFHASIPSTYRKHNVLNNSQHMKDDINETRKSTLTI